MQFCAQIVCLKRQCQQNYRFKLKGTILLSILSPMKKFFQDSIFRKEKYTDKNNFYVFPISSTSIYWKNMGSKLLENLHIFPKRPEKGSQTNPFQTSKAVNRKKISQFFSYTKSNSYSSNQHISSSNLNHWVCYLEY